MEDKPEFVKSLTKATDKYIKEARELRKKDIKKVEAAMKNDPILKEYL